MKKIFSLILVTSLFLHLVMPAVAQTPTKATNATPSPQTTSEEKEQSLIDQINNLKEKVASKVAELRLVEKRGVIGVVTQSADNKITFTDINGTTRYADVDELTKFSSPDAEGTFGISDITKNMQISVIGLYNKDSKRILARFVDVVAVPVFITGHITDIDKINFTITVTSADHNKSLIDIENITKTSTYTEKDDLARAGFSKLAQGERVHVIGYVNKKDKKRITGTRIIAFPELPKNPKINTPERIEASPTPKPTAAE